MKNKICRPAFLVIVSSALLPFSYAHAADGTWNTDAAGNWTDITKWLGDAAYAQGADYTATLGNFITANRIITLNTAVTIGNITASDTSHDYTISGTNILTLDVTAGSPTIDVAAGRTLTISSVIAGNDGFTKTGAGTATLSGLNTISGAVTVSGGVVNFNQSGSRTLASLSGTGGFHRLSGDNTLSIQDASAFHGNLRLSAGGNSSHALQFGSLGDDVGAGNLQYAGGTGDSNQRITFRLYDNVGALTLNNRRIEFIAKPGNWSFRDAILQNNNATAANKFVINTNLLNNQDRNHNFQLGGTNTGDNEFAGVIGDSTRGTYYSTEVGRLSLIKADAGKWILANTNTYSGTTTISAGTLVVSSSANLGNASATNSLVFNGGTLQAGGAFTSAATRGVTMTGAGTINTNGNAVDIAGIISGTGALTKSGAGDLTLSNINTLTGTTTISAGKVVMTNALALQNSAYITTGSNGTTIGLDVTNGLSSGNLTLGGLAGAVNLASAFTGGFTGTVTNLTLNPQTGISNTYSGQIANGAMALTKTGDGTQLLSGTNTYSGGTTVSQGILQPNTVSSLPGYNSLGKVVFNGGTLATRIGGSNWTTAQVDTLLSNSTKTSGFLGIDTTNANLTQWTDFTTTNLDSAGLNKLGSNTLTLNGNNSYTGGTVLTAGTLSVGSATAVPSTGTISFNGATIQSSDSTARSFANPIAVIANITVGGTGNLTFTDTGSTALGATRTFTINTGVNATFAQSFTGSGSGITKAGNGTLTLTGNNSYTGTTTVSAGSIEINGGTTSSGAVTMGSGTSLTIKNGGTLNSTGNSDIGSSAASNNTVSVLGGSGGTSTWNVGNGNLAILGYNPAKANNDMTIDGVGVAASAIVTNIQDLQWARSNYNSDLLVTNGGRLNVNRDAQIGSTYYGETGINNTITIQGGTANSIMTVGRDFFVGFGDRAAASSNTATVGAGGQLTVTQHMYVGHVNNTGNSDNPATNNKLMLTGGGTASMNQLSLGFADADGRDAGANIVEVTSGGQLSSRGTTYIGRADNPTTTSNANTVTFSGMGSSWTAGNQTVYVGHTNNASAQSNNNILTIGTGGSLTSVSNLIVGFGSGTETGNKVILNGGTISATTITVSASNIFEIGANGGGLSGNIVNSGALNIGSDVAFSLAGNITGTGGVVMHSGSGITTFSGSNTYTGGTTISGGSLVFGTTASKPGSGTHAFAAGTILGLGVGGAGFFDAADITNAFAGTMTGNLSGITVMSSTHVGIDTTAGNFTYSDGIVGNPTKGLTKLGVNTLTLSGSNTYTGDTQVTAGRLTLSGSNSFGGGSISVASGAILDLANDGALGGVGSLNLASGAVLDNTSEVAVTVNHAGLEKTLGNSLNFAGTQDLSLGAGATTLTANTTFDIAASKLTLTGNVTGAYGIIKNGAGTLVFSGLTTGSFVGNSEVNAGELFLDGTSVLAGTADNTIILNTGGTLRIGATGGTGAVTVVNNGGTLITTEIQNSNQTFVGEEITLTSSNAKLNGVQKISSGSTVSAASDFFGTTPGNAAAGRIVMEDGAVMRSTNAINIHANKGIRLSGDSATFDTSSGTIFINSQVTGNGKLVKTGSGGFRALNTSNSYEGGTEILGGTFGIYGDGSLGAAGTSVRIDGATLNSGQGTSGQTITIGSARSIEIAKGKTNHLDATNGSTLVFDGVISEFGSSGAGDLQINTAGSREGIVILGGANTYTGATTVSGGTLRIHGSTLASSNFTVQSGATLGGRGTIGGSVTLNSGATLAPGASIESLETGSNTWNGGSNYEFEFSTDGSSGTAGAQWDLLAITGSLDLTGAHSENPITLSLVSMLNATDRGALSIWNSDANATWAGFVTTTGGITGFAADKFAFDTTQFLNTLNGTFSVSQNGNNLDLNYMTNYVIPEPKAVLLGAMGVLMLLRRRR